MSILPLYDFSPTLNAGYLKKIVPLLTQHHIAANPINYAIFYDYVAGHNVALNCAINQLLYEQKPFDCDTSLQLYGQHICNASFESFEKINLRIQKVIDQASNNINETCNKAEETSDSFQKKTAILENISEISSLQTILEEIIQETKSLVVTSQAMQSQLNNANAEMEQLRSELAKVREIAITDGLTGLLNRRAFDQTLTDVVRQSNNHNTYLSLLDIDHFKRVNDTYGHTIGDNVIKFVASLMKKHARPHHYVARYGGEELAIIMPNTSKLEAVDISETIRVEMEKSRLVRKTDNTPLGRITISIGIAALQSGDDAESFLMRADKALYQAKESGRNKVIH
ncbi:GGDEF domain-containing protein [Methylomonas sp. MgM2]